MSLNSFVDHGFTSHLLQVSLCSTFMQARLKNLVVYSQLVVLSCHHCCDDSSIIKMNFSLLLYGGNLTFIHAM